MHRGSFSNGLVELKIMAWERLTAFAVDEVVNSRALGNLDAALGGLSHSNFRGVTFDYRCGLDEFQRQQVSLEMVHVGSTGKIHFASQLAS